jgi:IS5 family transposase
MRNFVGIDLGNEAAPDETTICKFCQLIENNGLGKMMLTAVNDHLKSKGIKIGTGTIMDATLISAPSSTKNEKGEGRASAADHQAEFWLQPCSLSGVGEERDAL